MGWSTWESLSLQTCHTFHAKSVRANLRHGLRKVLLEKFKRCWRLWQVRFTALSHEDQACVGGRRVGGRYTPWTPGDFELYQDSTKRLDQNCLHKAVQDQELFSLFADQLECPQRPTSQVSHAGCAAEPGSSELLPLGRLVYPSQFLAVAAGATQGLGPAKGVSFPMPRARPGSWKLLKATAPAVDTRSFGVRFVENTFPG